MNKKYIIFFLVFLSLVFSHLSVYSGTGPIGSCRYFLNLKYDDILSRNEQSYLGISQKSSYSLKDMEGTIFIIEVFNTYCTICPKNIPVINKIFSTIEEYKLLKDKINVIGIAIGNNDREVSEYKKDHNILFPVLTDYNFASHKALGNPRVPYTIIIRKIKKNKCAPVYTHQGILDSSDSIVNLLKESRASLPSR
jgi:hypothetical protein